MKTPANLLSDLQEALRSMEDDFLSISDYARLLQGATSHKEIIPEEQIPGIYRLLFEIADRADAIAKQQDAATQIVNRLRHP